MFRSRRLVVFVGVVLAGALLQGFAGPGGIARLLNISTLQYFVSGFFIAALAAFFTPRAAERPLDEEDEFDDSWSGGSSEFLCDTCRYNDIRDCHRSERPNATVCDDYSRR